MKYAAHLEIDPLQSHHPTVSKNSGSIKHYSHHCYSLTSIPLRYDKISGSATISKTDLVLEQTRRSHLSTKYKSTN